jgi:glutathione S-transferase
MAARLCCTVVALKLYAVPASHPSACVEAALRLKEIPYERVDLITGVHVLQQAARFGKRTVPALAGDGVRIVGSGAILRWLDGAVPKPPLFPADADRRARVEEAEQWGEEVLQPAARRIVWAALRRASSSAGSYLRGARLPISANVAVRAAPLVTPFERWMNKASEGNVRKDLRALPGWLERIDAWVADRTLGGQKLNAADLQIGSSLALLMTLGDLRPLLEERPAARLVERAFPDYPGNTPAGALPADWLPGPARPA